MRITKQRTLTGLILAVLMALPFVSIASRVIYVQANKNAYQSYSDNQMLQQEVKLTSHNAIISGDTLQYVYVENGITNGFNTKVGFSQLSFDPTDYGWNNNQWVSIQTTYNNGNNYIYLYDTNGTFQAKNIWGTDITSFSIVANGTLQDTNYNISNSNTDVYKLTFVASKLDNVFEYSVSQFVEGNNFGKVDMTSWFTDMFLDDNVHNNLYVNFVNWYLNYAMLITLMHFLFAVLMWFINYCRRLLDRGMNYDW